MPAAEQTYRNTPLLHKIFGIASVVMLVATIWMFAADHTREWKPYQRTSDNIDVKMTAWRELQFRTEEASRTLEEYEAKLTMARREPIPPQLLADFEAEVHSVERAAGQSRPARGGVPAERDHRRAARHREGCPVHRG
jgi:hypothetical protein